MGLSLLALIAKNCVYNYILYIIIFQEQTWRTHCLSNGVEYESYPSGSFHMVI